MRLRPSDAAELYLYINAQPRNRLELKKCLLGNFIVCIVYVHLTFQYFIKCNIKQILSVDLTTSLRHCQVNELIVEFVKHQYRGWFKN